MGNLHRRKGSKWWRYQWVDASGQLRTRTLKGIRDYKLARSIAAKIETENAQEILGYVDPTKKRLVSEMARAIGEQIDAWHEMLLAGNTRQYADEQTAIVRRVFTAAGVECLGQVVSGTIKSTIDRLPRTRGEGTLSSRQKGKALTACKMFCRQMVRDRKLALNPLAELSGWTEQTDPRHQRVAFDAQTATAIIKAARESDRTIEGLSGPQRAMLYELARGTGFRRRTLRELTPAHLHLDANPPFIQVLASNLKNKKAREQMIHPALAELLSKFVEGMAADKPIFPMSRRADTAAMMKFDCAAAGLAYKVDGFFMDFHSWRHTYGTDLGRSTGNIKVVQDLMGHSTPVLTSRYMRPTSRDYQSAIEGLPAGQSGKKTRKKSG